MKSSGKIRFDFSNALSQAQKLDDLADRLSRETVRGMEEDIQALQSAWTGESARKFVQKEGELEQAIERDARELRAIAEDIRRIARQIYDAEMRALALIRQRK